MNEFRVYIYKLKAYFTVIESFIESFIQQCVFQRSCQIFFRHIIDFLESFGQEITQKIEFIQISIYLTAPIFLSALFRSRIHIHCLHTGKAFVQLCHVYNYCSISVIKFNLVHFCPSRLQSYHKEIFKCQFPRFSSTHLCGVGQ